METNWKLVSGILAAVLIYDCRIAYKNKKRFARNQEVLKRANELTLFYASKLEEHQIPLDAFDRIIIDNI